MVRFLLLFLFTTFGVLVLSCQQALPTMEPLDPAAYPPEGTALPEGEPAVFFSGYKGLAQWHSDRDGFLGIGPVLRISLSPGIHHIFFTLEGRMSGLRQVKVLPRTWEPGVSRKYILPPGGSPPVLPKGNFHRVSLSVPPPERFRTLAPLTSEEGMKDLRIPLSKAVSRHSERNLIPEGTFQYIDPLTLTPQSLTADLVFSGQFVEFWLETGSQTNMSVLEDLFRTADEFILPRNRALWGNWEDMDGNGKVLILLTPRLTATGQVIGYFNPNDLYPGGNLKDMVYLALPDETQGWAFSPSSLKATIAHEVYHLMAFSQKTYRKLAPETEPPREELFLDEGLAHLTEVLCGYGISGGNAAYVSRYLQSPWDYSLGGLDRRGREDSVGNRGGILLFLNWLFWCQGGIALDPQQPGVLVDRGGITFLKKLIMSSQVGWENLDQALEGKAVLNLLDWGEALGKGKSVFPLSPTHDPDTGEAFWLDPWLGTIHLGQDEFTLSGPTWFPGDPDFLIHSPVWIKNTPLHSQESHTLWSTLWRVSGADPQE